MIKKLVVYPVQGMVVVEPIDSDMTRQFDKSEEPNILTCINERRGGWSDRDSV